MIELHSVWSAAGQAPDDHTTLDNVTTTSTPSNLSLGGPATRHLFWSPGIAALQVLAIFSSFIAAVLGNSVLLLAFYRSPQVRTLNNMLTLNLGVADILLALVVLPLWMSYLTKGGSSTSSCSCLAFITVLLVLSSICSLAAISLDRYLLICHPFDYPQALTSRRLMLVLCYIWIHSSFLAALPVLGWGHYTYTPGSMSFCGPDWTVSPSHSTVMLIIGFIVPLSIMLMSYTQVFRAASSQAKRIEHIQLQITHHNSVSDDEDDYVTGTVDRRRSSVLHKLLRHRMSTTSSSSTRPTSFSRNIKTIRTVFIVVGAFSLCWTPYVTLWMVAVVWDEKPAYSADFVTTWLALSACAINPYVFIFLNRDLRYTVRLVLARVEACLPGHDDAPHKVRLSYYGESIVDSNRIVSRSNDSGVDLEAAGAAAAEAARPSNINGKQYTESHLKPPGRTHTSLRDSRKPTVHGEEVRKEFKKQSTDVSSLSSDRAHASDNTRRPSPQPARPPPPTVAHRGSIPIIILPPDD